MRIPSTTIRLGAVIAAVALSLAFACPAFASSFSDVPDDAWYGASKEACVEYVAEKGFMTGYAGTDLFGPEDTLTRAQVVTALYRVITGDPDGLTSDPASYVASDKSGFSDTKGGMYYTAALNWAVSEDVARGSAGRFRPNDPVTREEFVTFMARSVDYERSPVYAQENPFP
ncbi:MAG: S-layer homology domain-containing protein, partial [Eggerthellaceae bacterium]|nr:S-layer homology domain-containing protein [Eggerthellaceae bacterium]